MTLFERTKKIAESRGYSIAKVEREAGLSENYLYTWKRTDNPRKGSLDAVAKVLGVSVDYLLGKDDTRKIPEWATEDDKIDLDKWLQSNVPMGFQGMDMDADTKEKVRAFLIGVYWEDKQKHRNDNNK